MTDFISYVLKPNWVECCQALVTNKAFWVFVLLNVVITSLCNYYVNNKE
mgnify:CR=1